MSNLNRVQFSDELLHRGIHGSKINEPLGMHWSEEPGVHTLRERREPVGASRFLGSEEDLNDPNLKRLQEGERGTIIHGHPQKGADKWRSSDRKALQGEGVIGAFSHEDDFHDDKLLQKESEVPLRPGKKIKVTGLTRVRDTEEGVKTRQVKYNPPRIKTI